VPPGLLCSTMTAKSAVARKHEGTSGMQGCLVFLVNAGKDKGRPGRRKVFFLSHGRVPLAHSA
jgi:hypothetical protein